MKKNSLDGFKRQIRNAKSAQFGNFDPKANISGRNYIGQSGNFGGSYIGNGYGNADPAGAMGSQEAQLIAALPQVDPGDSYLTVRVANSTSVAVSSVVVFNPYVNASVGATSNFNNVAAITITVPESSYAQLMEEIKAQPKFVSWVRLAAASSATQFSNPLTLTYKSAEGKFVSETVQLTRYNSPFQFNSLILDWTDASFPLDGNTGWSFTLNGSETVTFTLTVRTKVINSNALQGKPMLAYSNASNPSTKS